MDTYEVNYKIEKPKNTLKEEIKRLALASDDDREGESIEWYICKVCNLNIETSFVIPFR